jgi:hypothetical protein
MDLTTIPASASLGFLVLNFGQVPNGFDLGSFGLRFGCTGYVVLAGASTLAFPVTPPVGSFTLNIPNHPGLVSLVVYAQGAVLPVPGATVPALVSNGLAISLGI